MARPDDTMAKQRATRAVEYMRLGCGKSAVEHEISMGWYEGWNRGFSDHKAITERHKSKHFDALYFVIGWMYGALFMVAVMLH